MECKTIDIEKLKVNNVNGDDDVVTPWNVESKNETGVDYDKLIRKFSILTIK